MSQQELLKKVIQTLDRYEIPYMITGSVVSSMQGEPRSTHDVDLVIAIQKPKARALIEAFPSPDFYLDEQSVLDAIERKDMFNLIDMEGGDKVDFWILTDDPFDGSRFSRRYVENVMGLKIQVSSPEDTILAKLRWAELSGGSEKQFVDVLRVYEVQGRNLDTGYLDAWSKKLEIEPLWKRIKDEARIT